MLKLRNYFMESNSYAGRIGEHFFANNQDDLLHHYENIGSSGFDWLLSGYGSTSKKVV